MDFMEVLLHCIHLSSDSVSGDVVVDVCSYFPVPGVIFILGNDLPGGSVWGNSDAVVAVPTVLATPVKSRSDQCVQRSRMCNNSFHEK